MRSESAEKRASHMATGADANMSSKNIPPIASRKPALCRVAESKSRKDSIKQHANKNKMNYSCPAPGFAIGVQSPRQRARRRGHGLAEAGL